MITAHWIARDLEAENNREDHHEHIEPKVPGRHSRLWLRRLGRAKALRRAPVDVTVIDRTNHHLFQPLLYQMATGIVGAGDIAPPIRDILRRHANTRVLLGDVVDVDLDAREVTLEAVGRSTRVASDRRSRGLSVLLRAR